LEAPVRACSSEWHPQVPITIAELTVVYCHNCQAFVIYHLLHTQHSDDDVSIYMSGTDHLGPFDGADAAHAFARGYLSEMLRGSGRPWDTGPTWHAVDPDD
jgi:hypothetical protein